MKSPALPLIAILAIPIVAVELGTALGVPPATYARWYLGFGVVCVVVGVVIGVVGNALGPKPGQLDERAINRAMTGNIVGLGLGFNLLVLVLVTRGSESALVLSGVAMLWALLWMPRAMRQVGIRTSVVINRDPATVFAFVSDMRNSPAYFPEIESVEQVTPGSIGPGTQFRTRVRTPNGVFEGVEEIVDYEWASRLTSRVASGLRPNLEVLTFEPVQAATKLSHRFDSELSYGLAFFGQVLTKFALRREMVARRNAAWARLKNFLESTPSTV